ncbi:branched-chain amino acid ABC transporter substrate-binding protein [Hansschlegelia zhihuaiae]|uniref:Branched-chain amino acid ABC transporter substrate-binding protein n=1 Tax=Hansschlegelia zhihuaiae TaxID=405005 RepID=A0A4V1KJ54_9HYPH|nr:branched-chain amino acid ABC transporter substrate-binding protein [Hansschlegelia zhihuaiae]RXF73002.1 branched-chain amino acid ABC transporter substrate-binding protein [Hansschlegelia zhihuaiae]
MKRHLAALAGAALGVILAAPAYADIAIGIAGPMTGENAVFGQQIRNGVEQAIEDINAAGGVNGEKLVAKIGDDACDPKQAVNVANQLAGDDVDVVIGHYCSGSSIPASAVYAEEGVIQISPASTNPVYTDKRPEAGTTYRVCGRDDQQGGIAGKYILEKYKGKKVAIVHDKSSYGKGLADETMKTYEGGGTKPILYEAITAGEKDYSALVSKLKQAGAEVVYFGGYYQQAGLIVRQMREQGLNAVLMGGDALQSSEFLGITGKGGEGTLFTFPPDQRKLTEAAEVVKKFKAKKIEPEGFTLYSYAALQIWAAAATAAKSTDAEDVKVEMDKQTFKTVAGEVKFDQKGDPTVAGFVFYEFKDGAYQQM